MRKYKTSEKIVLTVGLIAIIASIYLKDYFIIPLVLISYSVIWIWNYFMGERE